MKNKQVGIVGVIITIIILIIIVIFSNGENGSSIFENAVSNIVMPIQNGLTYIKNQLSGNDVFLTDINDLKTQNEELIKKNSELEQSLRELENIKTENETLKEYLGLAEKYSEYKTIPAYIINKDLSNYSNTIIINIGADDGVEENMTVIADEGLVGYVVSVTSNTAKIQTIIDPASSISATLSSTEDSLICKGTLEESSTLKAMHIPTSANIVQGDTLETSGLGGIYPKGIKVGTVEKITNTQNLVDRYATVKTAVDFDKLNTVLVINNK